MARRISPLKIDPTRTKALRDRFAKRLGKKLERIKERTRLLMHREEQMRAEEGSEEEEVLEEEVEDIGGEDDDDDDEEDDRASESFAAMVGRWEWLSDPEKLGVFLEWLRSEIDEDIASPEARATNLTFMRQGWDSGVRRAGQSMAGRRGVIGYQEPPGGGSWPQGSHVLGRFGGPASEHRVRLLADKVYTHLDGVTRKMSDEMAKVLSEGMASGRNPRDIARDLVKRVDISQRRAEVIARTEIVRAHADGTLFALEQMGVERVGVMVEWSAVAADACLLCADLNGVVLTLHEATNMIPRHPSCRCAWIPSNVGEDSKGQKRGKSSIERAIGRSVQDETGGKRESSWAGAGVEVEARRPGSVLDAGTALVDFSRFAQELRQAQTRSGDPSPARGGDEDGDD